MKPVMSGTFALQVENVSFNYGSKKVVVACTACLFIVLSIYGYSPRAGLLGKKAAA
jgi:hypothetical protein